MRGKRRSFQQSWAASVQSGNSSAAGKIMEGTLCTMVTGSEISAPVSTAAAMMLCAKLSWVICVRWLAVSSRFGRCCIDWSCCGAGGSYGSLNVNNKRVESASDPARPSWL